LSESLSVSQTRKRLFVPDQENALKDSSSSPVLKAQGTDDVVLLATPHRRIIKAVRPDTTARDGNMTISNPTIPPSGTRYQPKSSQEPHAYDKDNSISSDEEEDPNEKRVRDIVTAVQNGVPGASPRPTPKRRKLDLVSRESSNIILDDSHNYFSILVRPAEILAETARHQMEKLQESANSAQKQLDGVTLMTEFVAKEQEEREMSLVTVVQEQVDEIARINAERDAKIEQARDWFNPLIASKQEEAVNAGNKADEYEEKQDSAQSTFLGAVCQLDVASTKYTTAERFKKIVQVVYMAIDGQNAEAVAQALEMRIGGETHMLLHGKTPEDLRLYFTINTPLDIANATYKCLEKKVANVLTKFGHEMGGDIHSITNVHKGEKGKQRSKELKEILFRIFFPGMEHPELNEKGRLMGW
jgi:hypothetical protein